MVTRVRAALVAVRTSLVKTARGLAKALGGRSPKCDADQMGILRADSLPPKQPQVSTTADTKGRQGCHSATAWTCVHL